METKEVKNDIITQRTERNKKYEGKRAKIEHLDYKHNPEYGDYLQISTEVLDVVETNNGEKLQIRASDNFSGEATDGVFTYKEGAKLSEFLKKYECKSPEDLKGKEVLVVLGKKGYLSIQ